jgi:hypothetical protein
MAQELTSLEQLLDRIGKTADNRNRIFLSTILETVGSRSFGPLLLMAGVILASPLSGIPGMPTAMGMLVLLIAVQLLLDRKHFWLPRWLLTRSVTRERLGLALRWMRPSARFIDRCVRPRLEILTSRTAANAIALVCLVIAAGIPLMELVPFSATGAGVALTAFGLSLIARDGFVALLAFAFTIVTCVLVAFNFL